MAMMEDQRSKVIPWSMSEVQTFLNVMAEGRIQKELAGATRNEKVFREIAQLMAGHGYHRTFQQCRDKLKKMKFDYRQAKDHNNRSGPNRKTWKWFGEMDALYRRLNQGKENGGDNATSLLQAIANDSVCATDECSVAVLSEDPSTLQASGPTSAAEATPARGTPRSCKNKEMAQERLVKMEDQTRKFNSWSVSEVQTFLSMVAEGRIQKELVGATRNEKVFREIAQLMASHGYIRTSQQCREKLKKLKSDYRQVKDHNNRSGSNRKMWRWFDLMDAVYGRRPANQAAAEKHSSQKTSPHSHKPFRGTCAATSQSPTSSSPPGCYPSRSTPQQRLLNVPLSSLRLCVPPLRLLSAILWRVAEQRQVKYYTRLEEFVCVILEVLPDLLSAKKRAELLLGLRAKFILELCRDTPSVNLQTMQPHLDRLYSIAKSASDMNKDPMVNAAVSDFVNLIQTILRSPQEKKHFFLEIYPLHYGPKYDAALQSMVWEFLHSLEKLLPVPSFHQVASLLDDPLHLEDSLNIEPKKLRNLLQYVKNGLLDPGSSSSAMKPNTILSTLSVSIAWPREQADTEKSISLSRDTQPSVKERDGQRTVDENVDRWPTNDEDLGGDLDEEDDILGCLNEHPQRDLNERHLNQQKVEMTGTNGYTSNQESTDNSRSEKAAPTSTGSDTGGSSPNSSSLETVSQRTDTAASGPPSQPTESSHVSVTGRDHLCKLCGLGFATLQGLKRHQAVHPEVLAERATATPGHLCSYCGRTFKSRFTLQCHIRVHTGERPYSCSVCGKSFTQQSIMSAHRRVHTGEKPHLCSVCGKAYITSGALLIHMRLHTGERPHKCEICGKAYRMACHLTVHRRFHTKDRPYACTVCDKRFSTSNLVKIHMRTHTGEKPYACKLCEKRFSTATTMKIHQRVHR
ncbi:uncharacterized protein LOC134094642 isoform X2 [Sardina pilchardus]|uniref:uncharacterized protein LOC134094642 isoform X2 n=1 Tax=Sardina pilchardus TaxID=27697 RepID=UPI002E163ED3